MRVPVACEPRLCTAWYGHIEGGLMQGDQGWTPASVGIPRARNIFVDYAGHTRNASQRQSGVKPPHSIVACDIIAARREGEEACDASRLADVGQWGASARSYADEARRVLRV
jgi:hypothetical protein